MSRRYFISHSSADKPFALALQAALPDSAWIDMYEIGVGDILLEEIAAGIENATDFVLLWSENSAASDWVRFEFHMAFIRHLEDRAIAIRIVTLDETPLPLPFRPFLQARRVGSPEEAAELVVGAPPRVPTLRAFINRNAEIGAIESALYSPSHGMIWLHGINGVGKRALVREALSRIVVDGTRTRTVELRAGTGFVELDLLISAQVGTPAPGDDLTEQQAEERVRAAVTDYAREGGVWVFTEAQHWLDEDGKARRVLRAVFEALGLARIDAAGKLAVFTTTRRPSLEGAPARESELHRVRGLEANFGVGLLRARGAEADDHVLRQATEELGGHPLALEIVAPELAQGVPIWEDFRARAATGIVGELDLEENTLRLLERLAAVDGPLPAQEYAGHLSIDDESLQRAIEEGSAYSVIEVHDAGYMRLHPLVRDFYMRGFRRSDSFIEETADLAERSRAQLAAAEPGSATYVDSLLVTYRLLCWSGQLAAAIALRQNLYGTLYETAVELYNQRRYADARRYLELVIESTDDNRSAKLYLARTLAYLGELPEARTLVDSILERSPNDHHAWRIRGRVEFIAREFASAISFYERSNELRRGQPSVLRDLGQARMRIGDWFGARGALEAAMERQARDPDPWLAFQYSQVLEHFEEFEEARRVISQAIRRDPQNVGFHHRLGRIAEALGDRQTAKAEYERCLALEPDYVESLVSLASLAADEREPETARRYLAAARRAPNARTAVLLNMEAKILLKEGELAQARQAIQAALADDREVVSLDLAARIELEAIATGEARCSDVSSTVRRYAEEIRVKGQAEQANGLLADLAAACE
ncbi:tetratricopeptide repeat protein [Solirubrobacter sp. CPCC 204708]|uniref:Tetratricopeptide repeat protein n=1 Tax=Solirubrobacter deserti TaxID=2282478 RepID=A0ABT4RID0_9ACTN|nr:toll/interleukin-1 receptor domain-containing protein [Solirubrobacter deserti]MBE2316563.1 tetratricopeptide repeat protein [Solirubrobacter deserti]MDA0138096.1 tetratricopeptide repeat protein [Solirubrobacter deserti]